MGHPNEKDPNGADDSSEDVLTSVRRLVSEPPEPGPRDAPSGARGKAPRSLIDGGPEGPYRLTPDMRVTRGFEEASTGMSYEAFEKMDALSAKLAALEAASGDLPDLVASDAIAFNPGAKPSDAEPAADEEDSNASEKPSEVRALAPDDSSNPADRDAGQDREDAEPDPSAAARDSESAPLAAEDALPATSSVGDLDVLDEDALRDLIGEMVREELRGDLGERITRNVRKLVRREIHRALASEKLE